MAEAPSSPGVVLGWTDGGPVTVTPLRPGTVLPAGRLAEVGGGPVAVAPGIVLRLGRPLHGPVTLPDVLDATTAVLAGVTVTGADPGDVRLVLGTVARPPDAVDLALLGVVLDADGSQLGTSCGAAALGHPAWAVARAAGVAGFELGFDAGCLAFSGPLLPPAMLAPGSHAVATFAHLGAVPVRVG